MRLLRLDLTRYGHLTDITLAFPPTARLHVVLGANEAGKSTALAAIGDALFGFPHRTPFAFLHRMEDLRLGFEMETSDGAREAFIRRKGNRGTLLDASGAPVPEAALTRLLGGAGRDLFASTYGLNAERLRAGADALLASGGEAGESLLAGMGVTNLRGALARLDDAAKALHGSRKRDQALSLAVEGWKAARAKADEASVRPRAWVEAQADLARIGEQLRAAREEAAALRQEESRLRRARLVRPVLAGLDACRAELAELADAPDMPANAGARLDASRAALRGAEEDARREAAAASRLEGERAALHSDPAVLAVQDALDALAGRRAGVAEILHAAPARDAQLAEYRAQATEAAAQLAAATPEAARDALPAAGVRQRAQRLLDRRTKAAAALDAAAKVLRAAERSRDEAARLAAGPAPPASAPLRRAVNAARDEGPLDRDLAQAETALAKAGMRSAQALGRLPLWTGSAAALAGCPLPLEPAEAAVAAQLAAAISALEVAVRALAEHRAEQDRLRAEVAELARDEMVPTRDVVQAGRDRRDAAWREVRAALAGEAPMGEQPHLAGRFETLRDEADRLADARAAEAERVNAYATRKARLGWLEARVTELEAAQRDALACRDEAQAAWTALWAPAGIEPQAPAAMAAWRRDRDAALKLVAEEEEARDRRDGLRTRRDAARARLAALLPGASGDLSGLIEAAEAACSAAEAAEAAHKTLLDRASAAAERAAEAERQYADAADDLGRLAEEQRAVATALGLAGEAPVEEMRAALDAWTRIAETAEAWRGAAARAESAHEAVAGFTRDVRDVLTRLGEPEEEDPVLAVARLTRRLADARKAAARAEELSRQGAERRAAVAEAEARRDAANGELDALRTLAGAVDLPALETGIRRTARRAELRLREADLAAELLRQGEGLDEAVLRAEAAAVDPDAALARLEEIEAGDAARQERLTSLGARKQAVETALAGMQAGHDAATHAQEARHHLAAARDAAERYARLHLARTLLAAGIERLRQERQAPLLRAAGVHFARLTEGRYMRLDAEEAEPGRVLLRAIRADAAECPMEALSEGSRDQLFLALRMAAVEAHAAGAEPLPLVADDLLAAFDDRRTAAALDALADLGRSVQVILFTHHAHIAAMAQRVPGASVQELTAAPSPALSAA